MPEPRFTYICCDASFDPGTGYAALAACMPGRPLTAEVVPCRNACEAERRAILLAMHAAASRRMRCVEFRSDAEGSVSRIQGHRDADPLTLQIRRKISLPPNGGVWRIAHVPRSHVQPAHELAKFIWAAFRRGRDLRIAEATA